MDISAAHLRALRAALFAALCVTLSSASHVLLSRMPLPPVTVAATGAAVFALAYPVAGLAFRPLLIAATVLVRTAAPRRPAPAPVRTAPSATSVPLLVHSVVRRGPPCALAA